MKPLVSYYGGKQRIAYRIVELIPPHTCYVEPYAGGLAVLFKKPYPKLQDKGSYIEVINDKFEYLVNMYKVAVDKNTRDDFINLVKRTPYSKAEYQHAMQIYREPEKYTPVEHAWGCYLTLNWAYANKWRGGWGFGPRGKNFPFVQQNRNKILEEQINRLSEVYIECDDALVILDKWDAESTFFYCDPPYVGTDLGHYSGFTPDDFQKLIDKLDKIKGQFILSTYPTSQVPSNWEKVEIDAVMSAKRRLKPSSEECKRTECLYYRFHECYQKQYRLF